MWSTDVRPFGMQRTSFTLYFLTTVSLLFWSIFRGHNMDLIRGLQFIINDASQIKRKIHLFSIVTWATSHIDFVEVCTKVNLIQRPARKCANLAKLDPCRTRQKSQARAGKNFSPPCTIFLDDALTTRWGIAPTPSHICHVARCRVRPR